MALQMLRTTIYIVSLMAISCTSPQTVEFLGFEGCPNTPILRERLQHAAPNYDIVEVDLIQLEQGDKRLGWGAPTILLDGRDLFGESSSGGNVSCRAWAEGLPSVGAIRVALQEQSK